VNLARLSYLESCRQLSALNDKGEPPRIPDCLPRYDDDETWGINFFRELVRERDLSNLTLPRTYFGRSQIEQVLFRNTDLTESNLCWNDFLDVDFSEAVLVRCDLRGSLFKRVSFVGANLQGAEIRLSSFNNCVFDGAIMDGAVASLSQRAELPLSKPQQISINWRDEDGPEPSGG
jgi:BTB/POZ domain-containing protein KCTD9